MFIVENTALERKPPHDCECLLIITMCVGLSFFTFKVRINNLVIS